MEIKNSSHILILSPLPPPLGGIASWTVSLFMYFSFNSIDNVEHINTAIKFRRVTHINKSLRIVSGIIKSISVLFKLLNHILFFKPDVIHLTSSASLGLFTDRAIVSLASFFNIPIIIHWRFGRIPSLSIQQNWEWNLLRNLIRNCDASIVIDRISLNVLFQAGMTNNVYIPNPTSLVIEKKAKELKVNFNERSSRRILFVGHVTKNKGIFELIEACLTLNSVFELIVIGPYEKNVKHDLMKIASVRDNGSWLTFTGSLIKADVLEQMIRSPFLVLPSYTEGFPNVVIEAMAMGCAIIATEVGAIPDIIDFYSEAPCGICVPTHNIESLKKAITTLLDNPLEAMTMGKRGVTKILNCFTLEKIVPQYQNLWTKVSTKVN